MNTQLTMQTFDNALSRNREKIQNLVLHIYQGRKYISKDFGEHCKRITLLIV